MNKLSKKIMQNCFAFDDKNPKKESGAQFKEIQRPTRDGLQRHRDHNYNQTHQNQMQPHQISDYKMGPPLTDRQADRFGSSMHGEFLHRGDFGFNQSLDNGNMKKKTKGTKDKATLGIIAGSTIKGDKVNNNLAILIENKIISTKESSKPNEKETSANKKDFSKKEKNLFGTSDLGVTDDKKNHQKKSLHSRLHPKSSLQIDRKLEYEIGSPKGIESTCQQNTNNKDKDHSAHQSKPLQKIIKPSKTSALKSSQISAIDKGSFKVKKCPMTAEKEKNLKTKSLIKANTGNTFVKKSSKDNIYKPLATKDPIPRKKSKNNIASLKLTTTDKDINVNYFTESKKYQNQNQKEIPSQFSNVPSGTTTNTKKKASGIFKLNFDLMSNNKKGSSENIKQQTAELKSNFDKLKINFDNLQYDSNATNKKIPNPKNQSNIGGGGSTTHTKKHRRIVSQKEKPEVLSHIATQLPRNFTQSNIAGSLPTSNNTDPDFINIGKYFSNEAIGIEKTNNGGPLITKKETAGEKKSYRSEYLCKTARGTAEPLNKNSGTTASWIDIPLIKDVVVHSQDQQLKKSMKKIGYKTKKLVVNKNTIKKSIDIGKVGDFKLPTNRKDKGKETHLWSIGSKEGISNELGGKSGSPPKKFNSFDRQNLFHVSVSKYCDENKKANAKKSTKNLKSSTEKVPLAPNFENMTKKDKLNYNQMYSDWNEKSMEILKKDKQFKKKFDNQLFSTINSSSVNHTSEFDNFGKLTARSKSKSKSKSAGKQKKWNHQKIQNCKKSKGGINDIKIQNDKFYRKSNSPEHHSTNRNAQQHSKKIISKDDNPKKPKHQTRQEPPYDLRIEPNHYTITSEKEFQDYFENSCASAIQRAWRLYSLSKKNIESYIELHRGRESSSTDYIGGTHRNQRSQQEQKFDDLINIRYPGSSCSNDERKMTDREMESNCSSREELEPVCLKGSTDINFHKYNNKSGIFVESENNKHNESEFPVKMVQSEKSDNKDHSLTYNEINEENSRTITMIKENNRTDNGQESDVSKKPSQVSSDLPKQDFVKKYKYFAVEQIKRWEDVIENIKQFHDGAPDDIEGLDNLLDNLEKQGLVNLRILNEMIKASKKKNTTQGDKNVMLFSNRVLEKLKANTESHNLLPEIKKLAENNKMACPATPHDTKKDKEPIKDHSEIKGKDIYAKHNQILCSNIQYTESSNEIESKHRLEVQTQEKTNGKSSSEINDRTKFRSDFQIVQSNGGLNEFLHRETKSLLTDDQVDKFQLFKMGLDDLKLDCSELQTFEDPNNNSKKFDSEKVQHNANKEPIRPEIDVFKKKSNLLQNFNKDYDDVNAIKEAMVGSELNFQTKLLELGCDKNTIGLPKKIDVVGQEVVHYKENGAEIEINMKKFEVTKIPNIVDTESKEKTINLTNTISGCDEITGYYEERSHTDRIVRNVQKSDTESGIEQTTEENLIYESYDLANQMEHFEITDPESSTNNNINIDMNIDVNITPTDDNIIGVIGEKLKHHLKASISSADDNFISTALEKNTNNESARKRSSEKAKQRRQINKIGNPIKCKKFIEEAESEFNILINENNNIHCVDDTSYDRTANKSSSLKKPKTNKKNNKEDRWVDIDSSKNEETKYYLQSSSLYPNTSLKNDRCYFSKTHNMRSPKSVCISANGENIYDDLQQFSKASIGKGRSSHSMTHQANVKNLENKNQIEIDLESDMLAKLIGDKDDMIGNYMDDKIFKKKTGITSPKENITRNLIGFNSPLNTEMTQINIKKEELKAVEKCVDQTQEIIIEDTLRVNQQKKDNAVDDIIHIEDNQSHQQILSAHPVQQQMLFDKFSDNFKSDFVVDNKNLISDLQHTQQDQLLEYQKESQLQEQDSLIKKQKPDFLDIDLFNNTDNNRQNNKNYVNPGNVINLFDHLDSINSNRKVDGDFHNNNNENYIANDEKLIQDYSSNEDQLNQDNSKKSKPFKNVSKKIEGLNLPEIKDLKFRFELSPNNPKIKAERNEYIAIEENIKLDPVGPPKKDLGSYIGEPTNIDFPIIFPKKSNNSKNSQKVSDLINVEENPDPSPFSVSNINNYSNMINLTDKDTVKILNSDSKISLNIDLEIFKQGLGPSNKKGQNPLGQNDILQNRVGNFNENNNNKEEFNYEDNYQEFNIIENSNDELPVKDEYSTNSNQNLIDFENGRRLEEEDDENNLKIVDLIPSNGESENYGDLIDPNDIDTKSENFSPPEYDDNSPEIKKAFDIIACQADKNYRGKKNLAQVKKVDLLTNDILDFLVKEMLEDDDFLNCLVRKDPRTKQVEGQAKINNDIEEYLYILVHELHGTLFQLLKNSEILRIDSQKFEYLTRPATNQKVTTIQHDT